MSGYERDYREPDAETLSKLAQLYEVSIDYLVDGDKRPIDKPAEKSDNSPHIESFSGVATANVFPVGRMVLVPIVANISCGEPLLAETNVVGYMPVDSNMIPVHNANEYVWLRASGDSMAPKFEDGSLVLLHLQPEVENGEVAAVVVDNEDATLKRIHIMGDSVLLVADNAMYKPMSFESSRIRIVGKAVWVASKV